MNRPDLYKKTVNILYQAYFNDTLEHGNYCGCAVGNLIAANTPGVKITFSDSDSGGRIRWNGDLDIGEHWYKILSGGERSKIGLKHIKSTGYNEMELYRIEKAFEGADDGDSEEGFMFNGLVAVLEVLKQIHEVTDEDNINNDRFTEHYQKRCARV